MKRRVWLLRGAQLGGVTTLLGLVGLLIMGSGIVPIKASSGHWRITAALLDFAKRRSVSTHTLAATTLPNLTDPALILRGAGHYEGGCRPCHGSPELHQPRIARAMTPLPPYLAPRISRWDASELFYLVKHGIKFTGMPAWPAQQRDDEVHAVVAFLLEMPKLDVSRYQRLVHGEQRPKSSNIPLAELPETDKVPGAVERSCARCHGHDGQGRGLGAFPKLAGQQANYLVGALRAYTQDKRHSGIMQPVAAGLTEPEILRLADYYASLAPSRPEADTDKAQAERGACIADEGVPGVGVPACKECHGPTRHARNPAYPNLAGQYASYLELQLQLFKRQQRGGAAYAHLMQHVAGRLSEQQMRDVAAYYASLNPEDVNRE
ncbi:MAG TPA: c-type cytochrome [Polyangiaceae bacterium]|nr:c-type cytochrome [Polyangiaceae bacterium]